MRTLVQLSDLHFGAIDPRLLDPLRAKVQALAPHLVIVSGDLTQRAKAHQFEAARAWLATLPGPQVVVPGNHDVPLYNGASRFLAPLRRYRRHFSGELEPSFVDERYEEPPGILVTAGICPLLRRYSRVTTSRFFSNWMTRRCPTPTSFFMISSARVISRNAPAMSPRSRRRRPRLLRRIETT